MATAPNIPSTLSQKQSICKKLFSKLVIAHFELLGTPKEQLKDDMAFKYSLGRTTHLGELYHHEAVELNTYLYHLLTELNKNKPTDPRNGQRLKIIAHCRACGWEVVKEGKLVADMPRIYKWVEINFKADLNALSSEQLSKVIVAAENMEKSHRKAVQ